MVIRRTPGEWAEIVESFKKSGQTQVAFCREHGINEKTLGAHVRAESERKQIVKRSAEEWITLIAEQQSSGMNRTAWCKKQGISPDSMTSAEKRLKSQIQAEPRPEWVELNLKGKAEALSVQKEEIPCGLKIRSGSLEIEAPTGYPVEKLAFLIERLVKQC